MPVDPSTLEDFDGKQVILTLIEEDGSAREVEGKVEAASAAGVAFKEKGKRDVELVEPKSIEEIALAPVKPKTLAQKKLKEVTESSARQHLLDRHGYERSVVNGMSDEQAFAEHEDIDHADLGHKHVAADDDDSEDENGEDAGDSEE
jgi:hypothetical protein